MHNKTFEIVILVYLISVFCIPSSLGIYKRTSTGTKTIDIADWSVALDQTGVNGSVQVTEGDANGSTYTLNVVSNSEVDVIYDIKISNIPSGVQVKLGNGTYQPQNSTVTFTNAGTILYGAGPNTHTITFKANSGATIVNNQTINIDVDFKQS
jgi:hypothetical protein